MKALLVLATACSVRAPASERPVIDRFSASAAHLMVRTADNHFPGPDQPIDFDHPPFVTQSFGPDGRVVRYYNFDVQPDMPMTRWRLVRAGTRAAIQPDIIDRIPGDPGYSDFSRTAWVEVPAEVAPGAITSAQQIRERGFPIAPDRTIVDCPVVPAGSIAREGPPPIEVWYRHTKVTCFPFGDPLLEEAGLVPTSPIYVTFAGTGPESGFRKQGPTQTHNVVFSVPGDADYSPLWAVHVYDRAAFDSVHDEATALAAPLVKTAPAVNCPIVFVAP